MHETALFGCFLISRYQADESYFAVPSNLAVPRTADQIDVHVMPFGCPRDGVYRQPAPARRPERFLAVHAHPGGRMKPAFHPGEAAPLDLRKAGTVIAPPVVCLQPFLREGIPDHLVQIAQDVRHRAHGIVVIHQPDGLSKTAGCSCGPNYAVTRVGWFDYLVSHSFPSGSSGRTGVDPGPDQPIRGINASSAP